ncbi:MAG: uroporphyrinogen-III synthase [Chitinophagaceae bacterium]|nr:MAG: uroporphyrinogen-III synthase [Chitinophagaceae bacterium]
MAKNKTAPPVKSILISQPPPENGKSPFLDIANKYKIKVDFRPFIEVQPVSYKDFRKNKIEIPEYTAVIFNSRNSVDHFFRICEESRLKISQDMKYFCISESIALYLQKYILYRKRKVFFGNGSNSSLIELVIKHKEKERFLLPCSDVHKKDALDTLKKNDVNFDMAIMYKTVSTDLSDLKDLTYDAIIFFSPAGLKSLFENFPDFKQNKTRIGGFGPYTEKAIQDAGLEMQIKAPTKDTPSMTMAIEKYINQVNK